MHSEMTARFNQEATQVWSKLEGNAGKDLIAAASNTSGQEQSFLSEQIHFHVLLSLIFKARYVDRKAKCCQFSPSAFNTQRKSEIPG